MKKLVVAIAVVVLVAGLGLWLGGHRVWPAEIYRFDDVTGPQGRDTIAAPVPLRLDAVSGGPNRLAVLVTDPGADWMGLVRGLKAHGVPALFTASPTKALHHQVVIAYPSISGKLLHRSDLQALAQHVRDGVRC